MNFITFSFKLRKPNSAASDDKPAAVSSVTAISFPLTASRNTLNASLFTFDRTGYGDGGGLARKTSQNWKNGRVAI
jgi:hypothetical protein